MFKLVNAISNLPADDITAFCAFLPVASVWIDSFCVLFASKAIPELQVAGISHETYFIILINNSVLFFFAKLDTLSVFICVCAVWVAS